MARVVVLKVAVVLDPVPGAFHEPGDFVRHIQGMLDNAFPWYHPAVTLAPAHEQPCEHTTIPGNCVTTGCQSSEG